jgi:hypothetical protein
MAHKAGLNMNHTILTAHLPNAEIEISRRVLPEHDGESVLIRITATPSLDVFARWLEASLFPLAPIMMFWTEAMLHAWEPWLPLSTQALHALPNMKSKDA